MILAASRFNNIPNAPSIFFKDIFWQRIRPKASARVSARCGPAGFALWRSAKVGRILIQENLVMKAILGLIGAAILLATAGCDWDEDHHHHDRGGYYGGYYGEYPYRYYGHGEYRPYDRPYDRDRDWH
jgi:hypothetical protein